MNPRERFIRQRSAQLGLDPDAVVAISSVEGQRALHGGVSVGDNGTSFGPFQLHVGGALPAGKDSAWAHSNAGIDYALRRMSAVARGLKGKDAVSAIASRFERPADIPGEIAKAMQFYGSGGGALSAEPGIPATSGMSPQAGMAQEALRSMTAATLLQQSRSLAAGAPPDTSGLLALAVARRQSDAAQQTYGSEPASGPLAGSAPMPGGRASFVGNIQGENPQFLRSVQAAASAIGGTKIRVNSGYRSPEHNHEVGGASNSNHMYGHAMDGDVFIPSRGWVPLGLALQNVAPKFGLRSGSTFTWGGKPDHPHVDDGYNQRTHK